MKKTYLSILSTLFILASVGVLINQIVPTNGISTFLSFPSILFLIVNLALVIILTHTYTYFIKGIKTLFDVNCDITPDERIKVVETFSLLIKATTAIVALTFIVSLVGILSIFGGSLEIGPITAIGILSIFYGVILNLFFSIIKYKVKIQG